MTPTLRLLMSLSLSGSILAMLAFVLKPLIRDRVSKSVQYWIWVIVLLRFLMPLTLEGSLMNRVFFGTPQTVTSITQTPEGVEGGEISDPNVEVTPGKFDGAPLSIMALAANYIWKLGALAFLVYYIAGYLRFSRQLRITNIPALPNDTTILTNLLEGHHRRIRLFRNRYVTTPMLIGLIQPAIIIPDIDYTEDELKNILLHEIAHHSRFDLVVKWMTVIASSVHWCNPVMYLIKRQVNLVGELACDEKVTAAFNLAQRRNYADTLVSVIAKPLGQSYLHVAMVEDKRSLKERVTAIVTPPKKSRKLLIMSALLLVLVLVVSLYLGAGTGVSSTPPNLYINTEESDFKEAIISSYTWKYFGGSSQAAGNPLDFDYQDENTITVAPRGQLVLGTTRIQADKQYDFTVDSITAYLNGQPDDISKPNYMLGKIYLKAPSVEGSYIVDIHLDFGRRGQVNYGFVIEVRR